MDPPSARIIIGDSRLMPELGDSSIGLVVTSPPYWHIKDYGVSGQIGYGQSLHEYLKNLYHVWNECFRVLTPGRRLCINIGDQFARASVYGRYKVVPLHGEFISQCEEIGFDFLGSIIWQKKTTMNTTGGATVMGSYPYPPNGIVEIDYEHILIFKKPGKPAKVPKEVKERSKLSKEEWKEYFKGHWNFGGAKQIGHEAMFPEELPKRLIKMFCFFGEIVLDPFAGSGTTLKVAMELGRHAVGYEINEDFIELMERKLVQTKGSPGDARTSFSVFHRNESFSLPPIAYIPRIRDASPLSNPDKAADQPELHKVVEIIDEQTIQLDKGLKVRLLGVKVNNRKEAIRYLKEFVLKRKVFLKFDDVGGDVGAETNVKERTGDTLTAYVYLKNHIFVNANLIKSGLAFPDPLCEHRLKDKFQNLQS